MMLPSNPVLSIVVDMSVTPVTSSAWLEIEDAMPTDASHLSTFLGGGQPVKIAIGPSGSESAQPFTIFPGGDEIMPFPFSAGQRLSLQAVGANITSGYLVINFFW